MLSALLPGCAAAFAALACSLLVRWIVTESAAATAAAAAASRTEEVALHYNALDHKVMLNTPSPGGCSNFAAARERLQWPCTGISEQDVARLMPAIAVVIGYSHHNSHAAQPQTGLIVFMAK